jgi:outer membrane protein assembly factor BamB
MDQQTPKFTAESVDEQLDQLLAHRLPASSNEQLVTDLSQMYQSDEHSLAKVWQRLGLEDEQPDGIVWQAETLRKASPTLQPASAKIHNLERKRPIMHQARKRSLTRTFALLAAACVTALIVGSMLVVFNLARPRQGSHIAAPSVPQEANLPQGIYINDSSHIFRLNVQTHQALWQQSMRNVAQIIPDGNAVYVLQSGQIFAVVKLDANTGAILWRDPLTAPKMDKNTTLSAQTTNLVLSQNRLYVGWQVWTQPTMIANKQKPQRTTLVNELYVFNALDGKQQAVYVNTSASEIAVGDGVIAISSQNNVQIYNAANGKLLWHMALIKGSNAQVIELSIVNNLLYATITSGDESSGQGQSAIVAYNITSSKQVWRSPTLSSTVLNNFTVDQNIIYFGTLDNIAKNNEFSGHVYAYDIQSNKQLWSKAVDGGAQEALIVSNGVVYTVADSGSQQHAHLVAFDTTTGTLKWQQTLSGSFLYSFTVSNGVIYISSYNAGELNNTAPVQIDARDANSGKVIWEDTQHGISNITPTE